MNNSSNNFTIAFYNIENLFDIENDPLTNDDDFLPTSAKRWTTKRYQKKLVKLVRLLYAQNNGSYLIKSEITICCLKSQFQSILELEAKKFKTDFLLKDSYNDKSLLLEILKNGNAETFREAMRNHLEPHFERILHLVKY